MLVGPEQYVEVYNSIKDEFYSSQEKKVSVFVATDCCDSVCATKTLQVIPTPQSAWCILLHLLYIKLAILPAGSCSQSFTETAFLMHCTRFHGTQKSSSSAEIFLQARR